MNQFLSHARGERWTAANPDAPARGARLVATRQADAARPPGLMIPTLGACFLSRHRRHDVVLTPPANTPMLAVAPAAAVVVGIVSCGAGDLGAHIVLRLTDGGHVTLARVTAGSLLVRVGQAVALGDPIARFGPAPMLARRHAGADPGGRASPFQLAAHAEHGNGGPRRVAACVPGRQVALLQPLWPVLGGPDWRVAAAGWTIDLEGPTARHFAAGRDPIALLTDCLDLTVAAPPPAWLVGLWWRHDIVRGARWRRAIARFLPARSFATIVACDAGIGQLRVRLQASGSALPRLMRMEFGPDGLRWLHAEFTDGWLEAGRAGHQPGQGSTDSPGQTASQRAAFAR